MEFFREFERRLRWTVRFKLNGNNKKKVINNWAVAIMRYGVGVLEWRFDKPKELDRKT